MKSDPSDPAVGRKIGPYEILSMIGAGGMGEVYLAQDTRLGRKIALKLLPEPRTQDQDRIHRFEQEAIAASALNHPNILTVYDIGRVDKTHYIATEFIEGETLRQRMTRGKVKLNEALDIAIQAASALAAAHEAGIVHRDIKPDNIMVRPDGLVKVLDFGLAKLTETSASTPEQFKTQSGLVIGTASYMSPEQARGQKVDARSDLFGLGVVIYEIVTGTPSFEGETIADVIASLLATDPPPLSQLAPEIPPAFESIIDKAMRKDREDRYQNAKELLKDLNTVKRRVEFEDELKKSAPTIEFPVFEKQHKIAEIAVLPFKPISAEGRDEYLELGMADALITKLSDIKEIVVRPISAIRKYADLEYDPLTAGRKLKVDSVLEGNIQKLSDRIRVTARLLNVKDGASLWNGKFDEKFTDIFAVQDSISEKVATALALKLSGQEIERLTKRYTENTQAYHLYLKGRYYWNKRTVETLTKSIECYHQAITIEPNYALAYAGLADAYTYLGDAGITAVPPREAFAKGKAAAAKAVEIDEQLAETHTSLAHLHLHHFEWIDAEREFKRAFELKPNHATAHQIYSYYLLFMKRVEEALTEIKRALELDPLSVPINADVGEILYYSGNHEEAIEKFRVTLELDPQFYLVRLDLARAYEQKGKFPEAIEEFQKAVSLSGNNPQSLASLIRVYALSGKTDEAVRMLEDLNEISKHQYLSPYDLALIHEALGDRDQSFECLEKAYEERAGWIIYLTVDPRLDGLRADPRFADLVRRIGLPV